MTDKRRGLGRGLGALIPGGPPAARPVDVFWPDRTDSTGPEPADADTVGRSPADRDPAEGNPSEPDTAADAAGPGPAGARSPQASNGGFTGNIPLTGKDIGAEPSAVSVGDAEDGLVPVPGARFAELALDQVVPNPRQPRQAFDEEAMDELAHSIREIGVLQPVVVRPVPTGDGTARYELIMGERRWRASRQAGLERIPAIVRETSDDDLLRDALLENLQRSQLNPLEEAAAYSQLLDDFGCTHDELAGRLGRSRPQISNTIRLLKLPAVVQRRVAAGVLSAGHARALLGLTDAAAMERLAQRIVAEGLSVRATEEVVTLGGDTEPRTPIRRARPGERRDALDDLAARLSDRLDTRVRIALGKSKGRLTVEFASVSDLNRILSSLTPGEDGIMRVAEQG